MQVILVTIGGSARRSALGELAGEYIKRSSLAFEASWQSLRAVRDLEALCEKTGAFLILLDSTGKAEASEAFAGRLGGLRDNGRRVVVLAIGPPDGWTAAQLAVADHRLSLGPMTLPHALATAVLAEQIYRAATILARHPYHLGH